MWFSAVFFRSITTGEQMKKRIEQLLNSKFEYELLPLRLSDERICLEAGE